MLSRDHSRIIIRCDDTDVLVLLVYYWSRRALVDELYMHAGHSGKFVSKEQFKPIHHISTKLDKAACKSLPAVHALSRCDTTSALYRLWKANGIFSSHPKMQMPYRAWKHSRIFQDTFLDTARRFVFLMHGNNNNLKKNANLTAHQRIFKRLYQCQSKIFSTFLSKITKYNRAPLGFDPSVARLLGHDPTPRPTCPVHGNKTKNLSSLNELRFVLATNTDKPVSILPLTDDAFEQHALRRKSSQKQVRNLTSVSSVKNDSLSYYGPAEVG